jgi:hypothetical protein
LRVVGENPVLDDLQLAQVDVLRLDQLLHVANDLRVIRAELLPHPRDRLCRRVDPDDRNVGVDAFGHDGSLQ